VRLNLTWAGAVRRTSHAYFGDSGIIRCGESSVELSGAWGRERRQLAGGFSADSSHAEWYEPLLLEFLSRIERHDLDRGPLEEAVATVRWTAAAYESARLGRALKFGERVGLF
jgi:hypothetical protein